MSRQRRTQSRTIVRKLRDVDAMLNVGQDEAVLLQATVNAVNAFPSFGTVRSRPVIIGIDCRSLNINARGVSVDDLHVGPCQ